MTDLEEELKQCWQPMIESFKELEKAIKVTTDLTRDAARYTEEALTQTLLCAFYLNEYIKNLKEYNEKISDNIR